MSKLTGKALDRAVAKAMGLKSVNNCEAWVGLAEQPAPPPECKTEAEKTAFAFGWFKALESVREKPAQQCKWPTCQSEEYQQALAEQIKRELVGEQPAQQEPVAWWDANLGVFDEKHFDQLQPLYTSPPAQRTWVGLTDEEELQLASLMDKSRHWLVAAVEAKLRSKNGY